MGNQQAKRGKDRGAWSQFLCCVVHYSSMHTVQHTMRAEKIVHQIIVVGIFSRPTWRAYAVSTRDPKTFAK
eukprot:2923448-Amphidinium_carterae.1